MPRVKRSFTVEKKISVVNWHRENGNNYHATEREFGISRRRLREWNQNFATLLAHQFGKEKFKRKLHEGRKPFSDMLDNDLLEWLLDERIEGRAVSNIMLTEKAREIATRLDLPNARDFRASVGWLSRWKKRMNVGIRRGTNESQHLPEDYREQCNAFRQAVITFRQEQDYTPYNIANADQTMVRFDMAPKYTNNMVGEKTVRISNTGSSKSGFTVMLCAHASGHKKKAAIFFKENNGQIPPRVNAQLRIPNNVCVSASKNGWMTSEKMFEWLRRVWGRNIDDVRRLIILDRATVHTANAVQERVRELDTDMVYIPGGCTHLLQPADRSWCKPFKDRLRRQWVNWMQGAQRNARGNLKKPNRQNVIDWVSTAWESVSEEIVIKSFKLTGISNALDGTEDNLIDDQLPYEDGEELADEALGILFDEEDDDSDLDFEGFSDMDSDNN